LRYGQRGEAMDPKEIYAGQFRRLNDGSAPWLAALRAGAMQKFVELGFPTTKLEEWKYTSVRPIAEVPFHPAPLSATNGNLESHLSPYLLGRGVTLIFLDGRFVAERSQGGGLPVGAVVIPLERAIETQRSLVEPHLGHHASVASNAFVALNTAFVESGGFIYLRRDTVVEEPIHLLFLASASGEPLVSHPRNLVVADPGSQATIVETYVAQGQAVYFTNAVTEMLIGRNANVTHCKVQREGEAAFHTATVEALQERDSRFHSMSLSVGGALVRNEINTTFVGPGGECSLDGVYLASGGQHVDHHTSIDHRVPQCRSEELYKGVLDGRASAVFNGKVFVRPDAQKSDAQQANKNLLLSEDAVVNTKPQLEIFADDVKCSHGATIGRLEEDALFYLRSRGIDESAARTILVRGFVNEVLERIPVEELRVQLERVVRSRFGSAIDSEDDA
jgi:Fe-S cluster assembly protein SufD